MPALARRQHELGLTDVTLVDIDESKISTMAPLSQYAAQRAGGTFHLHWTSDAAAGLRGSDAVITTIRVGGEQGRVLDEQIATERGVLGQETTGPGGFAMALRTIPAVTRIAEMMRSICPDAWLLNFTNPAGLVAQAVSLAFPDMKVVGICDTPTGMHRRVAAAFGRSSREVPVRFFGLNHLSWMSEALIDGENVVPRIISDPGLARRIPELGLFEQDLLRIVRFLPNEYLYYYYYRDRAVANIRAAGETRGRQVQRLSSELLHDLREIDTSLHPDKGWERYQAYIDSRHGTYMATETGSAGMHAEEADEDQEEAPTGEEGEGYAGVALDILTASRRQPREVVANVPNRGAIPEMQDDDVVEIACRADAAGLHPIPVDSAGEDELLLARQVKRYERLTVEAVRARSRDVAVEALMSHPLVGSYRISRGLVDAYLEAHKEHVGQWTA
jgi:6-phospho-beta-glucosidase